MNKGYLFLITLLVSIPACGPFRKKSSVRPTHKNYATDVDIPVANDDVKGFFDEDLGEFVLADQASDVLANANDEYAWIEDAAKDDTEFKKIYFDFDKYTISSTQESALNYDTDHIKEVLKAEQTKNNDAQITIVVEGHACHSAGSSVYNLTLSEKRAKALQDRLVAAGVPRQSVKIVGRGQEVPALQNGVIVTGNREQQAPNRRDEIRVVVS